MSNQYRLVKLGNLELVAGLAKLVQQCNTLTAQVLAHLVELEERKLHLELGFSSLFAYCVEGLGMSEGTAGRRVAAVRVCRRFPGVFERVACGELHLCALCALAPYLNEENATELFEACKSKTRRRIEELLAARFPRPDVREQIRRLPARGQVRTRAAGRPLPPSLALDVLRDNGWREAPASRAVGPEAVRIELGPEAVRIELGPEAARIESNSGPRSVEPRSDARPRPRGRELEPLSAERFGVHFTADAELRDLIERARALASHRIPNGDLAALMKLMVASFVKREEKRRFGIGTRPQRAGSAKPSRSAESAAPPGGVSVPPCAAEPPAPPGGASVPSCTGEALIRAERPAPPERHDRYLPVQVRRETHARDGGRCAYISADGRRCNARAFLEFDHVKPFARFGSADVRNVRLLCKAHNLMHARNCFGTMHIAAKIAVRKSQFRGSAEVT